MSQLWTGFLLENGTKIRLIHIGLILEIGTVLLALVLFRFARILGGLLNLIHQPQLEVWLTVAGWLMILGFAVPHYLAVAVFYQNLANPDLVRLLWITRTISFAGLLLASICAFVPSLLYYRWSNR